MITTSRAKTFGELVTPAQLYWIERAHEACQMTKDQAEEISSLMFGCPIADLSRSGAEEFLLYLARVKEHAGSSHEHEHPCPNCSALFVCSQQFCNSTLNRYCDHCTAVVLGQFIESLVVRIKAMKA